MIPVAAALAPPPPEIEMLKLNRLTADCFEGYLSGFFPENTLVYCRWLRSEIKKGSVSRSFMQYAKNRIYEESQLNPNAPFILAFERVSFAIDLALKPRIERRSLHKIEVLAA